MVRGSLPHFYFVDISSKGSVDSEQIVYASDLSLCANLTQLCNSFSTEDNFIELAFPSRIHQVILYNCERSKPV